MIEYQQVIENIKFILSDAVDEFLEFDEQQLQNYDDETLFKLYEELTNVQSYLLNNLVFPLQDTCVQIGDLIVKHQEVAESTTK